MKRYKLLKELPTFAKGDLFEIRGDGCLWWIGDSSFKCGWGQGHWRREVMAYHKNTLDRFPNILKEWFEEVEQESYWCVDYIECGVDKLTVDYGDTEQDDFNESIGNKFETKKQAEKAVEKLKAITRLNKCGFRFEGYTDRDRASGGDIVIYAHVCIPNNNLLEEAQPDMLKDLDLLFGGER